MAEETGGELGRGTRIGNYRLYKKLGAGAMAEVWLARRRSKLGVNPWVALKVFPPGQDRQSLMGLLDEARMVSQIHHPNVAGLMELGEERDASRYYLAMEWVRGWTLHALRKRLKKKGARLPQAAILDIALGASRGLAAAHNAVGANGEALKLVHRDIKPTNLMIDVSGVVKVVDFGIAWASQRMTKTMAGLTKGTPQYMSPEQWAAGTLGPPSDVFSLGVVLIELITGTCPFPSGNMLKTFEVLKNTTPSQNTAPVAAVYPDLAPVLTRCLRRRPENRYQTMEALIDDLLALRARAPGGADLACLTDLLDPAVAGDRTTGLDADAFPDPEWKALLAACGRPGTGAPVQVSAPAPLPSQDDDAEQPTVPTLRTRAGADQLGPASRPPSPEPPSPEPPASQPLAPPQTPPRQPESKPAAAPRPTAPAPHPAPPAPAARPVWGMVAVALAIGFAIGALGARFLVPAPAASNPTPAPLGQRVTPPSRDEPGLEHSPVQTLAAGDTWNAEVRLRGALEGCRPVLRYGVLADGELSALPLEELEPARWAAPLVVPATAVTTGLQYRFECCEGDDCARWPVGSDVRWVPVAG